MQEDSPGSRGKRTRNERYSTPTKPKQLSVKAARQKAKEFATKDDKPTRVLAKQAILKELSAQLAVRALGLVPRNRSEEEKSKNDPVHSPVSNTKKQDRKPVKSTSKLPRRVDGAYASVQNKGQTKSVVQPKKKIPQQEAGFADKGDNQHEKRRKRFLAEKYLFIWKNKTYGRLTPATARAHYEKKLKQHTLQVWQDIWWTGRKGWKLNVRADYHNRYRLWQKSWKAWRQYVIYCRIKATKDKLAHHRAHHSLLAKCWSGWKAYIRIRRGKRQQNDGAMDLAYKQLKKHVWEHWLSQLAFKEKLQHMNNEALQFWAACLMSKAWRIWTTLYFERIEERNRLRMASQYSDRILLLKVWRGMKNYKAVKRLKQLRRDAAGRHFSLILLKKSFQTWVVSWQRQLELAQFDDLITYKGNVAVARRVLIHWKHYISLKKDMYKNEDVAANHYEKHLLTICFNALHLQSIQRRLKEMRVKMADDLHKKLRLQRVWSIWLKRCEHSEELKLHAVSRRARAHYRLQLKRKLFIIWVRYCQWRRFRKSQYAKADYHFREKALPRYFCQMMIFVDLMHAQKETILASRKFRREALLAKSFYLWWRRYQLMMDIRMMERMAILHNDEVVKRRCLRFWTQQARKVLRERRLEVVADDHYHHRLLLMGIRRWREFNREMKESRSVQHLSVRHYYIYLLKKTWTAWQRFVYFRQVKWRKQTRASLHYQRRLLSLVVGAWKDHYQHAKAVETQCEQRLQTCNTDRLRSAFERWKKNSKAEKEQRKNKIIGDRFFERALLSKCLSFWREFAAHRAVRKWQQWQRVWEIQQKLDKGKLYRSFRAWKSFKRRSVKDKILKNKALDHYEKTLLGKAVFTWKSYIHLCFRIKILQRQSMWLHNRRITAAFFRKWKKQHGAIVYEKRQTVQALWHWSVTLQRKAFYALLEYAILRKKKAVRIARALEVRRNRLLQAGVKQWMKVGFHLASERSRLAQERQLEVAQSLHQCVYRCAIHWRRVTANRVRQRGGRPRPKRVMSPQFDGPGTTSLESSHSAHSIQPSIYRWQVDRIASEAFKERPKPRKPDYLRESFDLAEISMATSLYPRVSSARVTAREEEDEAKPRTSPPRPSYLRRTIIHPHEMKAGEESFMFPSSSGEESFSGREGSESLVTDGRGSSKAVVHPKLQPSPKPLPKPAQISASVAPPIHMSPTGRAERRAVLLPPSSFTLPTRNKSNPLQLSLPDAAEVRASSSTHPASSPCTSIESEKEAASSPSAKVSPSKNSEDENNENSVGEVSEDEDANEGELDREAKRDKFKLDAREEAPKSSLFGELKKEGNLQERVIHMKNTLQEFHDMKVAYSRKKKQRDQLSVWVEEQIKELGPNHQDEELFQTQQCLLELTVEVNEIAQKIKRRRPLVEQVALNIRELIQQTGRGGPG